MSIGSICRLRLASVFLVTTVLLGFGARAHAALKLFPGTFQEIVDGDSNDQNLLPGIIGRLTAWDVPASPTIPSGLTFTGEVISNFTPATATAGSAASITITRAVLENPTAGFLGVGSSPQSPTDYTNMLQFASLDHTEMGGLGALNVRIRGRLRGGVPGTPPAPWSNATQQLRLGASDTRFVGPNLFAYAHAINPTPQNATAPGTVFLSAAGTASGAFPPMAGTLQLHIDDALVLGPGDRLILPRSIEFIAGDVSAVIPEPSGTALLAVGVMIASARGRKRR